MNYYTLTRLGRAELDQTSGSPNSMLTRRATNGGFGGIALCDLGKHMYLSEEVLTEPTDPGMVKSFIAAKELGYIRLATTTEVLIHSLRSTEL